MLCQANVFAQLLSLEALEKEQIYYSIDQAEREPDKALRLKVLRRAYTFPTVVPRMNKLQWLTMSHTLVEKIPAEIKNMEMLQVFELRGNKLKSLPEELCALKNLRRLDLSKNYLSALPKNFSQLEHLEWLDL